MNKTTSPSASPGGTSGRWVFIAIVISWVVAYLLARAILEREGLSLAARWVVALLPVAVLTGVFILAMRAIRRADELEKLIHLLATAIALPLIAVTVLAIAMLQHAGILSGAGGATDLWPFMTSFYLLGYVIARAHYHASETQDIKDANDAGDGADKA